MGGVGGESRHYHGTDVPQVEAWTCPACDTEQVGPISAGCSSCGSGAAQAYRAVETPNGRLPGEFQERQAAPAGNAAPRRREGSTVRPLAATDLQALAEQWAAQHPEATLVDAFMAGVRMAFAEPTQLVSVPEAPLRPEGKVARTLAAALQHFRDHVLVSADEEIQSGEWCSPAEVDELIASYQEHT